MIVIKHSDGFLLVLPSSLIDKVIAKLRMYVLRSKVILQDHRSNLRLIGLSTTLPITTLALPEATMAVVEQPFNIVKLPSFAQRYLCLLDQTMVEDFLTQLRKDGFNQHGCDDWRYLEISSGIPWFDLPQSELYIPQMLNLDQLGGISFNKGCYTGQEIVARTHYLGQSKRQLYLAEADVALTEDCLELNVIDAASGEKIGNVLTKQNFQGNTRLLLVLQTVDDPTKSLILEDANRTALKLLPCQ